jgi:hypothetical protein
VLMSVYDSVQCPVVLVLEELSNYNGSSLNPFRCEIFISSFRKFAISTISWFVALF